MRPGHGPARYLAPAAFLLAFTIAVLVVRAGMGEDDATAPPTVSVATTAATTATGNARPARTTRTATTGAAAQFYEIQAGDTLDKVALEHDTNVERLLELNPGVDTNSLQIGQRIRVR